jgi:intracellular multiplication protein IcmO
LGETGGFDPTLPYNKQKSDEPAKQHSFVTMHFSATFTQLAVSLGHIFKCEIGDIDMRDVVLNRRILLVNLPALENSGETTAALGRIVVAAQRNVMAQTLGADLEGDYAEIVGNNLSIAPTPYPIIFDEVRYYVVPGMDKMLAMGRALGFMFYLGFQEVAGLRAQIGDAMYSLLGNANFQILMRLQEGSETRRYVEQTAGDTNVVQSSTYRVNDMGNYREAQHAEIRRVSRVEWNDLRGLIEGEAIILFGNRRVYAKLFYADVDLDGPMRLNRPIMLKPPTDDSAREIAASIEDVRDAVEKGWAQPDGEANDNPALKFLIEAFTQKAHIADDIEDYVDAVIVAAGSIEVVADPAISQTKLEPGKIPPAPPGELDPMLYSAGDHVASLEGRDGSVTAPVTEIDKQRSLAQVEELAGASAPAARIAAKEALAAGDAVAISARAILPPLPAGELRAVIDDLISMLDSIYA